MNFVSLEEGHTIIPVVTHNLSRGEYKLAHPSLMSHPFEIRQNDAVIYLKISSVCINNRQMLSLI